MSKQPSEGGNRVVSWVPVVLLVTFLIYFFVDLAEVYEYADLIWKRITGFF
jgi:hypothetical protein